MDIAKLELAINNKILNLAEVRFIHYFFDKITDYQRGLEELLKYSDDKETATLRVPKMSLREHFLLSASIREKLNNQEGER